MPNERRRIGDVDHRECRSPELIIRSQTPQEEIKYLEYVLGCTQFYHDHGYTYELPLGDFFDGFRLFPRQLSDQDRHDLAREFPCQYDLSHYENGLDAVQKEQGIIKPALVRMQELNKLWGLNMHERYTIALTAYGPGGAYDVDTGKIIMMTRRDGTFKRGTSPAHTIVHEMMHIGVEEKLVKGFGLTHPEKERLVDRVTCILCGDLLSGYQIQELGDPRIDGFVTVETLSDLPAAIGRYVNQYPRNAVGTNS